MDEHMVFSFIFPGDQKVTAVIYTLHMANISSSGLNKFLKFIHPFSATTHFRQLRQRVHRHQHGRGTAATCRDRQENLPKMGCQHSRAGASPRRRDLIVSSINSFITGHLYMLLPPSHAGVRRDPATHSWRHCS